MGRDFHSAFSQNSTGEQKLTKMDVSQENIDKMKKIQEMLKEKGHTGGTKSKTGEGELTAGDDYSYYGSGEESEQSKPVQRIGRKSGEELANLIAKVKAEQGSTTEGELTDEERAMAESLGEGAARDYDAELRATLNK